MRPRRRPRRRDGWRITPVSEPRLPSTPLHPIPHNGGIGMGGGGGVGTLGASQSQPSSRRLRRRCNEGCVIARSGLIMAVAAAATTGNGKQTQSRQWQADTGRPEVKERHGGAKETDRPMKDFLWGGEERGLNKASARPIPPATILLFCHRHNETPNHSFDITFTSREPHRIFYLMIIMVTRAGGWGRCLDGFKEPSSCGLSVTQQSERETTVSKKCARNDLSLFMLFSQQERERVKLRERGSR